MKHEELNSKKLRSILNTIRESCIYQNDLIVEYGVNSYRIKAIELSEFSPRNLQDEREFLALCDVVLENDVELLVVDGSKTYSVPLSFIERDGSQIKFKLSIARAVSKNRRQSDRERPNDSYFVPGQLRLRDPNIYSIPIFVRLHDFDSRGISFEMSIPLAVDQNALLGATITSCGEVFVDRGESIKIDSIREFRIEQKFGSAITKFVAISIIPQTVLDNGSKISVIQPEEPLIIELRPLTRAGTDLVKFKIEKINTTGFSGSLESLNTLKLPKYFLADHLVSRNRFAIYNDGQIFNISLLSKDLGHRTQWYSFLSQLVLHVQTKFAPEDSRAVTRLMLESGNYKPLAIAKVAQLKGYLEAMWPIEDGISRTKIRWLVRGEDGDVIGHTAGLRVSSNLWAAIDNVGSQSYSGRWNIEYVARWIRVFSEILNLEGNENLIQWTYSPIAGVWSEFEKKLIEHKDLIYCKNIFSDFFPDNLPTQIQKKSDFYSTEKIEEKDVREFIINNAFLSSANLLLESLFVTKSGMSFLNDFLLDYGIEHIRYYRLIKKEGRPKLLVSYTNYPFWASLNKGHDWIYIFEFKGMGISASEEDEILAIVRELVIADGCDPFRLALVDSDFCFRGGARFTNLIFRPAALELAAQSTEKSK